MSILAEIEACLAETGMSAHRFGVLAVNDSGMIPRLREGRTPTDAVAAKVRAFLAQDRASITAMIKTGPAPRQSLCACGAPVTRKAKQCRPCARKIIAEKTMRPMPDDFREVAPGKSVNALMEIYGCGPGPVARWRKEAGIPTNALVTIARHVPEKRKMPDGFALVARNMTMKGLRTHFKASAIQVSRWCAEAGVEPRKAGAIVYRQVQPRPLPDRRDNSRAGLAAQFLQRFGPVFRCDENGRANPEGKHWNRGGRTVLTDDEIIARAERNGWRPDAWKAIAA